MKLSFSLASKPSSKIPRKLASSGESAASGEFITEFDAAGTLADPDRPVIAPLPNAYNPHKRMKNLDAAIRQPGPGGPQFEVDCVAGSDDRGGDDISYGLNIRNSGNDWKVIVLICLITNFDLERLVF